MRYPPLEENNAELNIELAASMVEAQVEGDFISVMRGPRTRLVVEGLTERVQPYIEATRMLVTQEPGAPALPEPEELTVDEVPLPSQEVLEDWAGSAVLVQGEHRCEVECEYKVVRELLDVREGILARGLASWGGSFSCIGQLAWPAGEWAELVLADGRTGKVMVTSMEPIEVTPMGNDGYREYLVGGRGLFVGTGQPPGPHTTEGMDRSVVRHPSIG